ncbi:MAG TPA: hypothetical protein VKU38_00970 [Ktedonobacteraceae bacterium]|nr:hypothetical protein [Ktedonobacteraceae bacterium]
MATKPWDGKSKRVLIEIPQDTVDWLLPGAKFVSNLSPELEDETVYADLLFEVTINGKRALLHIEIQRNRHSHMAERMWDYNHRATIKYKCAVSSVVIYLIDDGQVATTPFIKDFPTGRIIHTFDFEVVKLWEIPSEFFRQRGLTGLLPFTPLTKNGARRETVDEVISRLAPTGEEPNKELLVLTFGLASLILITEADQQWLIRRIEEMHDFLYDTPVYQHIMRQGREKGLLEGLEEGRQEGLAKGRQEGLAKGRQEGQQETIHELREALLEVILELFPKIRVPAQEQVDAITNTLLLRQLIVKIVTFKTPEQALQYLRDINEYNTKR